MLGRTVFAATFFALAQFAMASPPGCLLGAVNQYEDPSDIKAVCKSKDLSSKVAELCGNDAEAAMEAIADICNDVDVDVCKYSLLQRMRCYTPDEKIKHSKLYFP